MYKSSAVAEMDDRLATIDTGRKLGAVPLFGGGGSSVLMAYLSIKWHLDPSSCLATTDMDRKWAEGGYAPIFEGGAGSLSNTVAWAEIYLRTKWHLNPSSRLATMDMGRKLGAVPLFWGEGAGSSSNTMWSGQGRGLPPYNVAS